jgi:hypothetical protein
VGGVLFAAALMIHSVTVPGTHLHVKLATQVGQAYDARTVAKDVRYLWGLGRFDDVRVEEPEPGALVFRVTPRPRLVVRDVRITPHSFGIEIKLPPGTPIDPAGARAIAADIERQLDARVEETLVPRGNGKVDLKLHVLTEKRKKAAPSDEIRYEIAKDLCRSLFLERRDFPETIARFDFERGLTLERARVYRVGRIEFMGHRHFSDSLIREHMLFDEGARFDERLLRKSVARLNRSAMFDPIDERNVLVARDDAQGIVNITLRLTERRRGAWNFAGPWPIQGTVGARLPKWATYAASVSVYGSSLKLLNLPGRFFPVFSIQRPYTPGLGWKSGLSFAPQLGLRGFGVGYAASQLQQRLMPVISGERSTEMPLVVTGEIGAACIAKPRLRVLRTGATMALGFLGSLM